MPFRASSNLAQRPFLLMPEWCDHCPHSSSEHCPVRCGHVNDQPPWSPMSRRGESDAYHKLWCCDCQVYCGDHSPHTGPAYDYEQLNIELYKAHKHPLLSYVMDLFRHLISALSAILPSRRVAQ
ncbi:hypothetical protein IW261DRAFT_1609746 [Armillaria novae-zelandiae]|uniref:Uncharacterized protein n=1 Tax=Armillaria novae-zelandiae TaxID=153914 RepID=A0AA39P2K6_9AGAR|nr:hypothetical protein IW261DRAFT_1609746 [Armillaria novae-zelandiae]